MRAGVGKYTNMPFGGDQDAGGKAKAYQVRQVLLVIDKLEELSRER